MNSDQVIKRKRKSIMERTATKIWNAMEAVLKWLCIYCFRMKCTGEKWDTFLQFVKFGIVGVSNTVISYVIYVVALSLFRSVEWINKVDYLAAQFLSFVISVLWSFILNRKFVFHADKESIPWVQALMKTYTSYAFTGVFLNSILSVLWIEWLGISKLVAPLINLLVSVPINFLLNKFWAFKGK